MNAITNKQDGLAATIFKHNLGFAVRFEDIDANEVIGIKIFGNLPDAEAYAWLCVFGRE